MALYLVKRPEHPEYVRPFTTVLLADCKPVAKWEAGCTRDGAWIWTRENSPDAGGWVLTRWNGLDIDYGYNFGVSRMPDGRSSGVEHEHPEEPKQTPYSWDILAGAVWWSRRPMPLWLGARGVIIATDEWTLFQINQSYWTVDARAAA